jgi:hypothetical protein
VFQSPNTIARFLVEQDQVVLIINVSEKNAGKDCDNKSGVCYLSMDHDMSVKTRELSKGSAIFLSSGNSVFISPGVDFIIITT